MKVNRVTHFCRAPTQSAGFSCSLAGGFLAIQLSDGTRRRTTDGEFDVVVYAGAVPETRRAVVRSGCERRYFPLPAMSAHLATIPERGPCRYDAGAGCVADPGQRSGASSAREAESA